MRTSIFSGSWLGLVAGVVALGWAVPASAQECADDAGCPKGFTCEVSESTACVDVACPEGDDSCEAREAECTVEEYRSCVSIDCSADSDCADGMVCETIQHERCSTPGAPADPGGAEPAPDDAPDSDDGADPAPPESSCEVEERNYCVPRYVLPCEADADCGPGFTCAASEVCACSGGGSSSGSSTTGGSAGMPEPPDDAGDAERPAEPLPEGEDDGVDGTDESCVCEPGPLSCQLVITECAASSDCPSGMTCEDNPEGSCSVSSDGEEECVTDPEKICLPPYIDLVGGSGIATDVEEDRGSSGSGEGPIDDPEDPQVGAPGETDDDGNAADGSDDGSASGGGCSVGAAGAPTGAWTSLALALGAAVLGRRRRSAR